MNIHTEARPLDRRSSVQSVDVAALVLDAMCELHRPAQLKDIAELAGLQTAKTHRYLASLVASGLARQDDDSGLYSLGPMALRLGVAAISGNDLINCASDALRNLCIKHQTSGHLAIWGENGPVLIRNEHGGPPIISTIGLGSTMPLIRSATGRAWLAFLPKRATKDIVEKERAALGFSQAELETMCTKIREQGFSEISGDLVPGLLAATFPVFGIDKNIQCTLTFISTDENFFEPERHNLRDLAATTKAISDPHF